MDDAEFTAAHDGVGARFVVRLAGAGWRWRQSVRPGVCRGWLTCSPRPHLRRAPA